MADLANRIMTGSISLTEVQQYFKDYNTDVISLSNGIKLHYRKGNCFVTKRHRKLGLNLFLSINRAN